MAKKSAVFLRVVLFSILSIFVKFGPLSAETPFVDDLAKTRSICRNFEAILAGIGFENVLVLPDTQGVITVSYENRLYRSEMAALAKVLQIAAEKDFKKKKIAIIIKQLDYPIIAFEIEHDLLQQFYLGQFSLEVLKKAIRFIDAAPIDREIRGRWSERNSSFGKIDITLDPIVDANLGNRDDPLKFKTSFDVLASSFLSRGVMLSSSVRIPVLNEINPVENESVRPYTAILNTIFPVGSNTFLSNNIGYFSGERYGLSAQLARYFWHGNAAISARVDFTGFLAYRKKKWFYSKPSLFTYNLEAYWQLTGYGFRAALSLGKFLLEDHGVRVSFGRYMRESRLDFFGIVTEGDRWGGVEFRVPLFPNKRMKPTRVRFNIPDVYLFEYNYLATDFGRSFEIVNDLIEFRSDLTENYILNHLDQLQPDETELPEQYSTSGSK